MPTYLREDEKEEEEEGEGEEGDGGGWRGMEEGEGGREKAEWDNTL